jgi:hypothetical protein
MTTTATETHWKPSPRVTITVGSLVRFGGGGPVWTDQDGQEHRLPLRGRWRVADIIRRGQRVWLEVVEQDPAAGAGARRTVLVAGRGYKRHGLLWRPYKVRKLKRGK